MLSQKARYAIRAILYMAAEGSEAEHFSVDRLAETLELPRAFLAKALQELARKGFVSSIKGPNGGFYLTPAQRQRTLKELIVALDGESLFQGCMLGLKECDAARPCPIHASVAVLRQSLEYQFGLHTIEVLAQTLKHSTMRI
ncbi:MAG: Rrf2 family transcriptional regulator [Bacteroidetes bacterium]|nr:MAG: Rrf2 family transcriptional regulator [Bacteroidota bacterium]